MMICACNNLPATGSPNSLSRPLLLGEETRTSEKRTRRDGRVARPEEPSLPLPLPGLSWLGLSGQPGAGLQHLELQVTCAGQPDRGLQEAGQFQRSTGAGATLWLELSEVRQALSSSSSRSGGPEREAPSCRPLLSVAETAG